MEGNKIFTNTISLGDLDVIELLGIPHSNSFSSSPKGKPAEAHAMRAQAPHSPKQS